MSLNKIPSKAMIEVEMPIQDISKLAVSEGNSKKPIYTVHKWWARRLSSVVRALILGSTLSSDVSFEEFWNAYYSKNDLSDLTVMDPFMGGGTSVVESKKMGAKIIGIDVDPMACFITKKEIECFDEDEIVSAYDEILQIVEPKIKKYYETKINNEKFQVINFFWSYQIQCDDCSSKIIIQPHYYLSKGKDENVCFCKNCGEIEYISSKRKRIDCSCGKRTIVEKGNYEKGLVLCGRCNKKITASEAIKKSRKKKLIAIEYLKNGKRHFKKADKYDLDLFNEVIKEYDKLKDILPITKDEIPINSSGDGRPQSHGYTRFDNLFNVRQLLTLGFIKEEILKYPNNVLKEWMLIIFSDMLASNNQLCTYAYGYKKLTPLFGIHAYTVPMRIAENNVIGTDSLGRGTLKKTLKKLIRAKKYSENPYELKLTSKGKKKIYTKELITDTVTTDAEDFYETQDNNTLILNQSSTRLENIVDNSIDIVMTDPPYYDNLAYSDLARFYYSWIGKSIEFQNTNLKNETIFVGPEKSKEKKEFNKFVEQLTMVFKECHKKLKNDGIMVFSYHHNKKDAWTSLALAIKNSNFIVTNVFPIRSEGNSAYHSSKESIKWDSIIVLRKKGIGEDKTSFDPFKSDISNLEMTKADIKSFQRSICLTKFVNESGQSSEINKFFCKV